MGEVRMRQCMQRDICKKKKNHFAKKLVLEMLFEGCLDVDKKVGSISSPLKELTGLAGPVNFPGDK